MNELQNSSADEQGNQTESTVQQGAGELLKQAREAAGLHIAALAVRLKVPVKKLEALESDRLDLLPDAVFSRALASSVCRALKIDAAPVMARLPQTVAQKLPHRSTAINTPFRSPGDGPGPSFWAQMSRPAVLAGLMLLLGALVLTFLPAIKTRINEVKSNGPDGRQNGAGAAADKTGSVGMANIESEKLPPAVQSNAAPVFVAPIPLNEASTVAQGAVGAASSAMATDPSSAPASQSKVSTANVTAGIAPPTVVVTPKPPSVNDVIVFTAKGQSWVEATDANGQLVLRGILNAGEVTGLAGVLPLRVVVGRANKMQVQVRGKTFDLNAVAKDNVARFEVK